MGDRWKERETEREITRQTEEERDMRREKRVHILLQEDNLHFESVLC